MAVGPERPQTRLDDPMVEIWPLGTGDAGDLRRFGLTTMFRMTFCRRAGS